MHTTAKKTHTVLFHCFITAGILLFGFTHPSTSVASGNIEKTKSKKENKAPLISQKVYKLLTQAQELTNAKQFQKALNVLGQIKSRKRLNSTEKAQLWNFYAYIYFSLENYPKAIQAYETLLRQPDLQQGLKSGTLYTLSQLYFIQEDYKTALNRIQQWMALAEQPSPESYALLGQAYYKLKRFRQAIPAIRKAIDLRIQSGKKAKESWYLLLRASYYEQKNFSGMEKVVKELITQYPKPKYLKDLMGIYSQQGKSRKQLGLMEVLYEHKQLSKPSHYRNLASLYLIHGIPYKAARVLQDALEKKRIKKNSKTLELLSQAWLQARENKKAIQPLREAAKLTGKGEAWLRLGQAYANTDQWKNAVSALNTALSKRDIKKPGTAQILLGMSYYNMGLLEKAKKAFVKAAQSANNSPQNRKTAKRWAQYLEAEIERKQALSSTLR